MLARINEPLIDFKFHHNELFLALEHQDRQEDRLKCFLRVDVKAGMRNWMRKKIDDSGSGQIKPSSFIKKIIHFWNTY